MNEVINNILTRRSIREFTDKPVSKEDIELLIKAGMYAPSGMNKQTWNFIGIINKAKIKELAAVVGKVTGRDNYNFYNPTALIIVSNENDSKWGVEDNSCALQNIFLAAHSMDIGSVWINQLSAGNCDAPELREMLESLGVPNNHAVYGIAALGYSANQPKGIVEKTGKFSIIE